MQNLCCQNVLKVKFLKIVAEYLLFTLFDYELVAKITFYDY